MRINGTVSSLLGAYHFFRHCIYSTRNDDAMLTLSIQKYIKEVKGQLINRVLYVVYKGIHLHRERTHQPTGEYFLNEKVEQSFRKSRGP